MKARCGVGGARGKPSGVFGVGWVEKSRKWTPHGLFLFVPVGFACCCKRAILVFVLFK